MKGILFKPEMIKAIRSGKKTQTRRIVTPQPPNSWMFWGLSKGSALFKDLEVDDFDTAQNNLRVKPRYYPSEIVYIKEPHFSYGHWVQDGTTKTGKQKWRFAHLYPPSTRHNDFPGFMYPEGDPVEALKKYTDGEGWYKRSPLFMQAKHARHFVKFESVRVERLQEITEEDAKAEGVECALYGQEGYRNYLWHGLHRNGEGNKISNSWGCQYSNYLDAKGSFSSLWELVNGKGSWESNPWTWVYTFERTEKPCE